MALSYISYLCADIHGDVKRIFTVHRAKGILDDMAKKHVATERGDEGEAKADGKE